MRGFGSRLRFLFVRHCNVVILRSVDSFGAKISLPFHRHLVQHGLCFRLIECRLKWRGVNREKQISFFHVGAVLKMARHDFPADLGLHLHRFVGGTGSDLIQIEWNVFAGHLRNQNGTDWRWRRFLVPKGERTKEKDDEQ